MIALDYLVMTWPEISTLQSVEPDLRGFVRAPRAGVRFGYKGLQGLQSFIGYSAYFRRTMLVLTGAYADECAPKIPASLDPYASVARIDIQSTFRARRADEFIRTLRCQARYKGTRIIPEDGMGTTFYVGSRSSNLFCRTYNKSYEAGMPPDASGEFVRVEFCLRDRYADEAWKWYRRGDLEEAFSSLVSRMFTEESAKCILEKARVRMSKSDLDLLKLDVYDWRERRLRWLETTVVPSLNRLIVEAPDMLSRVWHALDNLPKLDDNQN